MGLLPVGSPDGCLQIAQVIETVKDTDDVDSVGSGLLHEVLYHIVCIMVVSQNVLSTEQHLQFGGLEPGL